MISTRLQVLCSLILLALHGAGCKSSTKIFSQSDPNVQLTQYTTFAWKLDDVPPIKNKKFDTELFQKNLAFLVNQTLEEKGYLTNVARPDAFLVYKLAVEDKEKVVQESTNNYYPYGMMPYSSMGFYNPWAFSPWANPWMFNNMGPSRTYKVKYEEESISVGIIDAQTDQMVWQGFMVIDVDNPAELAEKLPTLIKKLYKDYPAIQGAK
ncbi:MAG TPA: hypothetical protein DCM08_11025 [Microscillaceae bacterium]|jgi:hypothetical protein|nr:hypothetical protein [Microscillaceae bacterium]